MVDWTRSGGRELGTGSWGSVKCIVYTYYITIEIHPISKILFYFKFEFDIPPRFFIVRTTVLYHLNSNAI